MSETAEGLAQSCDFHKTSSEDLVYDLFKLPQREEASIGRLVSVNFRLSNHFLSTFIFLKLFLIFFLKF